MEEEVRKKLRLECDNQKLWRAKRLVLAKASGDHNECFPKLHKYENVLKLLNLGSMALEIFIFRRFLEFSSPKKWLSYSVKTIYWS